MRVHQRAGDTAVALSMFYTECDYNLHEFRLLMSGSQHMQSDNVAFGHFRYV